MILRRHEKKFLLSLYQMGFQVLILPNRRFIGIGDGDTDDSLIEGSISSTSDRFLEIDSDGQVSTFDFDPSVMDFIRQSKSTPAVANFWISGLMIKKMKSVVSKLDATHLRFHQKDATVWVNIFDYRSFMYDERIKKDHPFVVGTQDLKERCTNDFSFTMNASSFRKMPVQDYSVRVGANGYADFASADEKQVDFTWGVKGQDVIEPVVTFFNDQFGGDISLVLSPTPDHGCLPTTR
jgi:hypothetical protein